jgi:hypothetical protein
MKVPSMRMMAVSAGSVVALTWLTSSAAGAAVSATTSTSAKNGYLGPGGVRGQPCLGRERNVHEFGR